MDLRIIGQRGPLLPVEVEEPRQGSQGDNGLKRSGDRQGTWGAGEAE